MKEASTTNVPRWLHGWAVATAAVAFPLILTGGSVTSWKVGMADPEWPTPPWYMLLADTIGRGLGFAIEHSHRQVGWLVGVMAVVLAVGLWIHERRPWARWLGLAALLAVGSQGVLGGLRVVWNARYGTELALLHGFTGQLVFTLLASTALVTGKRWREGEASESTDAGRFQFLALAATVLLVGQLGLGVWLRHFGVALEVHLILGLAILGLIAVLGVFARGSASRLGRTPTFLMHLVAVQVLLGLASWWVGGGKGAMDPTPVNTALGATRALLSTLHVGVGALVLATSTILSLKAFRHLHAVPKPTNVSLTPTERVA